MKEFKVMFRIGNSGKTVIRDVLAEDENQAKEKIKDSLAFVAIHPANKLNVDITAIKERLVKWYE